MKHATIISLQIIIFLFLSALFVVGLKFGYPKLWVFAGSFLLSFIGAGIFFQGWWMSHLFTWCARKHFRAKREIRINSRLSYFNKQFINVDEFADGMLLRSGVIYEFPSELDWNDVTEGKRYCTWKGYDRKVHIENAH